MCDSPQGSYLPIRLGLSRGSGLPKTSLTCIKETKRLDSMKERSSLLDLVFLDQAPKGAPLHVRCQRRVGHIAVTSAKQLGDVRPFKLLDAVGFGLLKTGTSG